MSKTPYSKLSFEEYINERLSTDNSLWVALQKFSYLTSPMNITTHYKKKTLGSMYRNLDINGFNEDYDAWVLENNPFPQKKEKVKNGRKHKKKLQKRVVDNRGVASKRKRRISIS
jgi:23S rRNA A1618 N6-methylase RlmF